MFKALPLLLLLSLPAYADELQFDFTGEAESTVDGSNIGPMQLDFMLDSTAGVQTFIMNGTTLYAWGVSGSKVTDFSFVVNGGNVLTAASLPSSMGGIGIGSTVFNGLGFGDQGGLTWDSSGLNGPSTVSEVFRSFDFSNTGAGTISNIDFTVTKGDVRVVSVPEPGVLPLMALGLLLVTVLALRNRRAAVNLGRHCRQDKPAYRG